MHLDSLSRGGNSLPKVGKVKKVTYYALVRLLGESHPNEENQCRRECLHQLKEALYKRYWQVIYSDRLPVESA
jgi:predicted  nucleic acid-binding Zn ribbon protein